MATVRAQNLQVHSSLEYFNDPNFLTLILRTSFINVARRVSQKLV